MTSVALLTLVLVAGSPSIRSDDCRVNAANTLLSYDEFMTTPAQERANRFDGLRPENKSCLKRTHAKRWLESNRSRLSAAQIDAVEQGIAFLTPDIYLHPDRSHIVDREAEIKKTLACALGRDEAQGAFSFNQDPPRVRGLKQRVGSWLEWFSECVM